MQIFAPDSVHFFAGDFFLFDSEFQLLLQIYFWGLTRKDAAIKKSEFEIFFGKFLEGMIDLEYLNSINI